jgi:hypothetical protein
MENMVDLDRCGSRMGWDEENDTYRVNRKENERKDRVFRVVEGECCWFLPACP